MCYHTSGVHAKHQTTLSTLFMQNKSLEFPHQPRSFLVILHFVGPVQFINQNYIMNISRTKLNNHHVFTIKLNKTVRTTASGRYALVGLAKE